MGLYQARNSSYQHSATSHFYRVSSRSVTSWLNWKNDTRSFPRSTNRLVNVIVKWDRACGREIWVVAQMEASILGWVTLLDVIEWVWRLTSGKYGCLFLNEFIDYAINFTFPWSEPSTCSLLDPFQVLIIAIHHQSDLSQSNSQDTGFDVRTSPFSTVNNAHLYRYHRFTISRMRFPQKPRWMVPCSSMVGRSQLSVSALSIINFR